jgi:hypothetical protein
MAAPESASSTEPAKPTERGLEGRIKDWFPSKCSASTVGGAVLGLIAGAAAGATIAGSVEDGRVKAFLIVLAALVGLIGGAAAGAALACWPEPPRPSGS